MLYIDLYRDITTWDGVTWIEAGLYKVERLEKKRALIVVTYAKPRQVTYVPLSAGKLLIEPNLRLKENYELTS